MSWIDFLYYPVRSFLHSRLRLSERNLRDELEATHISTQARESELLDEIQLLQSRQQMVLGHLHFFFFFTRPDDPDHFLHVGEQHLRLIGTRQWRDVYGTRYSVTTDKYDT